MEQINSMVMVYNLGKNEKIVYSVSDKTWTAQFPANLADFSFFLPRII